MSEFNLEELIDSLNEKEKEYLDIFIEYFKDDLTESDYNSLFINDNNISTDNYNYYIYSEYELIDRQKELAKYLAEEYLESIRDNIVIYDYLELILSNFEEYLYEDYIDMLDNNNIKYLEIDDYIFSNEEL